MSLEKNNKQIKKKSNGAFAAVLRILGTLMLILAILVTLPTAVPKLLGYEVYCVISPSMEPAIPTGSLIYVNKEVAQQDIVAGDVIAFTKDGDLVSHRVVENNISKEEFITKGDANESNDLKPTEYRSYIGKVTRHIPVIGEYLMTFLDTEGQIVAMVFVLVGAALSLIGNLRAPVKKKKEDFTQIVFDDEEPEVDTADEDVDVNISFDQDFTDLSSLLDEEPIPPVSEAQGDEEIEDAVFIPGLYDGVEEKEPVERQRQRRRFGKLRAALIAIFALVFVISLGGIIINRIPYWQSKKIYDDTAKEYTTPTEKSSSSETDPEGDLKKPPIQVDFAALKAINPDIVGWIYCEGTTINYPVLHGKSNDTYIHTTYLGEYNFAGSIFIDAANMTDFSDNNTIIYGHNMADHSMFASLGLWQEQEFFDSHNVIWLLTPKQNYRIEPFSAYITYATDKAYVIYRGVGQELASYVDWVASRSFVESDKQLYHQGRYVLLSTCTNAEGDLRSVVHGMLVPVGK